VRRPALPATLLLACIAPTIAQAQHAGHHPPPEEDPHAGHAMPADEDPHAGHAMPADADPHAGHVMPPTASDTLLAPREPIPPLTDADRAAAFPDVAGHAVHDTARHAFVLVDRLETWDDDAPGVPLGWEILAWHGTDLRRTWLRTEGEASDRGIDHADIELLHGRAVAPWWDALAGVRHRIGDGPSRTDLALGVMGVAPMKFEVSATAYLGIDGRASAIVGAEYETLLTNRLVLQWHGEAEFHGRDDPARDIGSGLASTGAGLRLRYEFTRKVAPYVGIARERAHGGTADLRRAAGHEIADTRVVAGFRTWF